MLSFDEELCFINTRNLSVFRRCRTIIFNKSAEYLIKPQLTQLRRKDAFVVK